MNIRAFTTLFLVMAGVAFSCRNTPAVDLTDAVGQYPAGAMPFSLDELQRRTFLYFWELADEENLQIPDRAPSRTFSSIAATGFGLTAYLVGVERAFISREQAAERVLNTLKILEALPQGAAGFDVSGYKGFFYHFLTLDNATRYKSAELSTIDSALLMAGILSVMTYFDRENDREKSIRQLADLLYRRVEWDWALNDNMRLSMGWRPEKGFISSDWRGYNEAMILLILALGSPTHPIPSECWNKWCETYQGTEYGEMEYLHFAPLFGHQYSHIFIDFRGIRDAAMLSRGLDYFENSRRATLANRAYCIENPRNFEGYSETLWGLTACDGPGYEIREFKARKVQFHGYSARGAWDEHAVDDGTIAPTAAGGSIPFAPEVCIPALQYMWNGYHRRLVGKYGFKDAFNLSYTFGKGNEEGWFDGDYLGIDQGPIVLQIENYRSAFIWDIMKKNPYILRGLKRAGFSGGWLEE